MTTAFTARALSTDAGRFPAPVTAAGTPGSTATGSALLVAVAVTLAVATAHAALAVDRYDATSYVWAALVHAAFYATAVVWVLRRPPQAGDLLLILVVALVLRGMAMTTAPGLSTDVFRYVWDGRLTLSGLSPYLYIPADERLAAFRDPAVFPHINQRDTAFTIYPPVAQLVFALGAWLDRLVGTATDAGHNGMKLVMLVFEAVTAAALLHWLRSAGLPRERVLIYAWHPLPLWEFAGQAHIDAAATALLVVAIAMAVRARQGIAGAFLALAALVKYFPVTLLPALWKRWDGRLVAAFAATALLLYLPHLVVAGPKVIGFLANHLDNEGYAAGWGFHPVWLIRDLGLGDPGGRAYTLIALGIMAWLAFVTVFARDHDEIRPGHLVLLSGAFIWLTSSHYPWYFGWLVPLLAVVPHPAGLWMTLAAAALHLPRPPGGITWTGIYLFVYWIPFLLLLAIEIPNMRAHLRARSH
jgi:hypothetical protein